MSSHKVLYGFHAVGVRLKIAPQSIVEIHFEVTRRDARMRQFIDRAKEAGAKLIDSDDDRLIRLAGSPRHQGVVAKVNPLAQVQKAATQLEQALINLLKNAQEAGGPADEVSLSVSAEAGQWLISVADRGPGIIMTAHETFGTGRGTLIELLCCIFGERYVRPVNFATLSGSTYQSQYNEWLENSLIVAVDEAQESNASVGRWQARHNAYEKLKEVVDPGNHRVDILRKGARNGPGRTYASILVMTNHADAVGLPLNDRRFFVCENGRPLSEEQAGAVRRWMRDPGNVGAFAEAVRTIDRTGYNPFAAPPLTASKQEMADASSSEMDRVVREIMAGFSNTLMVREQLLLKIEDYLNENAIEVPDDWQRIAETLFKRATRKLVDAPDRVRIEGKQRTVRVIGRVDKSVVSSSENIVEVVLSNGPISRQVRSTGTVVNFQRR